MVPPSAVLSRRERQVIDVLYRLGSATVSKVVSEMPEAASYSAVRAVLRTLEQKGLVKHRYRGPRYLYSPSVPREQARRGALNHLVQTYFAGSAEDAAVALLGTANVELTPETLEALAERIRRAKEEGE